MGDKKNRSLFILPDLGGGGAERVVLTLLKYINTENFSSTLLLLKNKGVYHNEVPDTIKMFYLSDQHSRIREDFRNKWIALSKIVKNTDIIIGCLELDATYLALILGKLFNKPVVGWVHTPICDYLEKVSWKHKLLFRLIYPHLNYLVYPSKTVQESVQCVISDKEIKHRIIHNPLNILYIQKKIDELLPEWAESIFDSTTLLAIGRLEAGKEFKKLIEAFELVVKSGWNVNLLILGEGLQRNELEQLIHEKGLRNRIYLPGFVSNPYFFIKRSTILIMPSSVEGFGMAVAEALFIGTPVVANEDTPSLCDILDGGAYGVLTPIYPSEEFANSILRLLSDEEKIKTLSIKGRDYVSARFSADKISKDWENLLCSIIHKS